MAGPVACSPLQWTRLCPARAPRTKSGGGWLPKRKWGRGPWAGKSLRRGRRCLCWSLCPTAARSWSWFRSTRLPSESASSLEAKSSRRAESSARRALAEHPAASLLSLRTHRPFCARSVTRPCPAALAHAVPTAGGSGGPVLGPCHWSDLEKVWMVPRPPPSH